MSYWWVNLGSTYNQEIQGFMWSPQRAKNGRRQSYDNMLLIQPGDIIFAHTKFHIRAVGIATAPAQASMKPDFGKAGSHWSQDGWLLEVSFTELKNPLNIPDNMNVLKGVLPKVHSPLRIDGEANQTYLFALPESMAEVLIKLLGQQYYEITNLKYVFDLQIKFDDPIENELHMRIGMSETEKLQLVKSRRGQGLFKINVQLVEKGCRVTGVTQKSLLIASHIKPWKDSNDEEKLIGFNGLLLAPHVDRLFDRGLMSFKNSGEMLLSPSLDFEVLQKWHISQNLNVGSFRKEQQEFLDFHRDVVFKSA